MRIEWFMLIFLVFQVRVWDPETGKEIRKLEGHPSFVISAAFSPDGSRIVSASNDKTVSV